MNRQLVETGGVFREEVSEDEKNRRYKSLEVGINNFLNNFFQITQLLLEQKIDISSLQTHSFGQHYSILYNFTAEFCYFNEPIMSIKMTPTNLFIKHGKGKVWYTEYDIKELNNKLEENKKDQKLFACYNSLKKAFVK